MSKPFREALACLMILTAIPTSIALSRYVCGLSDQTVRELLQMSFGPFCVLAIWAVVRMLSSIL